MPAYFGFVSNMVQKPLTGPELLHTNAAVGKAAHIKPPYVFVSMSLEHMEIKLLSRGTLKIASVAGKASTAWLRTYNSDN